MSTSIVRTLQNHPLWTTGADGLVLVADDGSIKGANPTFEHMFGYETDDLIGQSVDILVPDAAQETHVRQRARYGQEPRPRSMGASRLLEGRRKDGSTFPITISLSPTETPDGVLTIAAVRDLTARVAAEAEVAAAQRQRAIAEDHDRIASELHDTVIQQLFAVGLRLQGLPARMDSDHTIAVVNEAVDAIDGIIAEIRTTIHGLRAPAGPPRKLRSKILDVVSEMEDVLPGSPVIRFEGAVDELTDAVVIDNLLPTLREALSNLGRHARAATVDIGLHVNDTVTLEVKDNGIGIPEGVERSGLANLEARAKALGGSMTIGGNRGIGTVFRWSVPNPEPEDEVGT